MGEGCCPTSSLTRILSFRLARVPNWLLRPVSTRSAGAADLRASLLASQRTWFASSFHTFPALSFVDEFIFYALPFLFGVHMVATCLFFFISFHPFLPGRADCRSRLRVFVSF